ncbi:hypothetical protein BGAL_0544g00030 [Botrytis galanthina]|uniref:Uncharacterized protein n=1 Tax=Botrytis galanthina TaxID=278940 RepID=A0A4S8QN29_9HELO|nr:hypothetical protein BGAL_0544g00030 [Botrytis galanthina]
MPVGHFRSMSEVTGATRAVLILILHTMGTHDDALRLNLLKKLIPRITTEAVFESEDEREIRREAMWMARMLLGVNGVDVPKELAKFEELYQNSFDDAGAVPPDYYNTRDLNSAGGAQSDEDDIEETDSDDECNASINSVRLDSMELERYAMDRTF